MRKNIFFLIGDTGTGKTTVGEYLKNKFSYNLVNLDEIAYKIQLENNSIDSKECPIDLISLYNRLGPNNFFEPAKLFVNRYYEGNSISPIFIDVGAGFFNTSYFAEILNLGVVFKLSGNILDIYGCYESRMLVSGVNKYLSLKDYKENNIIFENKIISCNLKLLIQVNTTNELEVIAEFINREVKSIQDD